MPMTQLDGRRALLAPLLLALTVLAQSEVSTEGDLTVLARSVTCTDGGRFEAVGPVYAENDGGEFYTAAFTVCCTGGSRVWIQGVGDTGQQCYTMGRETDRGAPQRDESLEQSCQAGYIAGIAAANFGGKELAAPNNQNLRDAEAWLQLCPKQFCGISKLSIRCVGVIGPEILETPVQGNTLDIYKEDMTYVCGDQEVLESLQVIYDRTAFHAIVGHTCSPLRAESLQAGELLTGKDCGGDTRKLNVQCQGAASDSCGCVAAPEIDGPSDSSYYGCALAYASSNPPVDGWPLVTLPGVYTPDTSSLCGSGGAKSLSTSGWQKVVSDDDRCLSMSDDGGVTSRPCDVNDAAQVFRQVTVPGQDGQTIDALEPMSRPGTCVIMKTTGPEVACSCAELKLSALGVEVPDPIILTPVYVPTPVPNPVPVPTPVEVPVPTPVEVPVPTPVEVPVPTPVDVPVPTPVDVPVPTPVDVPVPTPVDVPVPTPVDVPVPTPVDVPVPTPVDVPVPTPVDVPTPTPVDVPTPSPTNKVPGGPVGEGTPPASPGDGGGEGGGGVGGGVIAEEEEPQAPVATAPTVEPAAPTPVGPGASPVPAEAPEAVAPQPPPVAVIEAPPEPPASPPVDSPEAAPAPDIVIEAGPAGDPAPSPDVTKSDQPAAAPGPDAEPPMLTLTPDAPSPEPASAPDDGLDEASAPSATPPMVTPTPDSSSPAAAPSPTAIPPVATPTPDAPPPAPAPDAGNAPQEPAAFAPATAPDATPPEASPTPDAPSPGPVSTPDAQPPAATPTAESPKAAPTPDASPSGPVPAPTAEPPVSPTPAPAVAPSPEEVKSEPAVAPGPSATPPVATPTPDAPLPEPAPAPDAGDGMTDEVSAPAPAPDTVSDVPAAAPAPAPVPAAEPPVATPTPDAPPPGPAPTPAPTVEPPVATLTPDAPLPGPAPTPAPTAEPPVATPTPDAPSPGPAPAPLLTEEPPTATPTPGATSPEPTSAPSPTAVPPVATPTPDAPSPEPAPAPDAGDGVVDEVDSEAPAPTPDTVSDVPAAAPAPEASATPPEATPTPNAPPPGPAPAPASGAGNPASAPTPVATPPEATPAPNAPPPSPLPAPAPAPTPSEPAAAPAPAAEPPVAPPDAPLPVSTPMPTPVPAPAPEPDVDVETDDVLDTDGPAPSPVEVSEGPLAVPPAALEPPPTPNATPLEAPAPAPVPADTATDSPDADLPGSEPPSDVDVVPAAAPSDEGSQAPVPAPAGDGAEASADAPAPAPTEGPTDTPKLEPISAPSEAPVPPAPSPASPAAMPAPTSAPAPAPITAPAPLPVPVPAPTEVGGPVPAPGPIESSTNAPVPAPIEAPVDAPAPVPAQGSTDASAPAPIDDTADSPSSAPVDDTEDAPAPSPTEATNDAPAPAPADNTPDVPAPAPVDDTPDAPAPAPIDDTSDEPAPAPVNDTADAPASAPVDETPDAPAPDPIDDTPDAPAPGPVETTDDAPAPAPNNDSAGAPVLGPTEEVVAAPAPAPVEGTQDTSAPAPSEDAADAPTPGPVAGGSDAPTKVGGDAAAPVPAQDAIAPTPVDGEEAVAPSPTDADAVAPVPAAADAPAPTPDTVYEEAPMPISDADTDAPAPGVGGGGDAPESASDVSPPVVAPIPDPVETGQGGSGSGVGPAEGPSQESSDGPVAVEAEDGDTPSGAPSAAPDPAEVASGTPPSDDPPADPEPPADDPPAEEPQAPAPVELPGGFLPPEPSQEPAPAPEEFLPPPPPPPPSDAEAPVPADPATAPEAVTPETPINPVPAPSPVSGEEPILRRRRRSLLQTNFCVTLEGLATWDIYRFEDAPSNADLFPSAAALLEEVKGLGGVTFAQNALGAPAWVNSDDILNSLVDTDPLAVCDWNGVLCNHGSGAVLQLLVNAVQGDEQRVGDLLVGLGPEFQAFYIKGSAASGSRPEAPEGSELTAAILVDTDVSGTIPATWASPRLHALTLLNNPQIEGPLPGDFVIAPRDMAVRIEGNNNEKPFCGSGNADTDVALTLALPKCSDEGFAPEEVYFQFALIEAPDSRRRALLQDSNCDQLRGGMETFLQQDLGFMMDLTQLDVVDEVTFSSNQDAPAAEDGGGRSRRSRNLLAALPTTAVALRGLLQSPTPTPEQCILLGRVAGPDAVPALKASLTPNNRRVFDAMRAATGGVIGNSLVSSTKPTEPLTVVVSVVDDSAAPNYIGNRGDGGSSNARTVAIGVGIALAVLLLVVAFGVLIWYRHYRKRSSSASSRPGSHGTSDKMLQSGNTTVVAVKPVQSSRSGHHNNSGTNGRSLESARHVVYREPEPFSPEEDSATEMQPLAAGPVLLNGAPHDPSSGSKESGSDKTAGSGAMRMKSHRLGSGAATTSVTVPRASQGTMDPRASTVALNSKSLEAQGGDYNKGGNTTSTMAWAMQSGAASSYARAAAASRTQRHGAPDDPRVASTPLESFAAPSAPSSARDASMSPEELKLGAVVASEMATSVSDLESVQSGSEVVSRKLSRVNTSGNARRTSSRSTAALPSSADYPDSKKLSKMSSREIHRRMRSSELKSQSQRLRAAQDSSVSASAASAAVAAVSGTSNQPLGGARSEENLPYGGAAAVAAAVAAAGISGSLSASPQKRITTTLDERDGVKLIATTRNRGANSPGASGNLLDEYAAALGDNFDSNARLASSLSLEHSVQLPQRPSATDNEASLMGGPLDNAFDEAATQKTMSPTSYASASIMSECTTVFTDVGGAVDEDDIDRLGHLLTRVQRELGGQVGSFRLKGARHRFMGRSSVVAFADGMWGGEYALKFYCDKEAAQTEFQLYRHAPDMNMVLPPVQELEDNTGGVLRLKDGTLVPPYLAMPRGLPLPEWYAMHRPVQTAILKMLEQAVYRLEQLHGAGYCHNDVKPANVLLLDAGVGRGAPKWHIVDFTCISQTNSECRARYTLEYASPEVVRAVGAMRASFVTCQPSMDIWSMGVIMFEVLSGRAFFPLECTRDGMRDALMGLEPLPLEGNPAWLARVPTAGELRTTLKAMLSRDPSKRPTAPKVKRAIRDCLSELLGEPVEEFKDYSPASSLGDRTASVAP